MNEASHRLESDLTGIPEGLFETAGFGALVIDPVEDRVISMTEPCARLLDGDALTLSGIRPSAPIRIARIACLDRGLPDRAGQLAVRVHLGHGPGPDG